MAIFTKLSKDEIKIFLNNYTNASITKHTPIYEGIQNSNYYLRTKNKKYILTIFEDNKIINDLDFYLDLLIFLKKNNFCCPFPIKTFKGHNYSKFYSKPAALFNFIDGKATKNILPIELLNLGKVLGSLHAFGFNFKSNKKNDYSINYIKSNLDFIIKYYAKKSTNLLNFLNKDISSYDNKLNIPRGIIHGDLFPDNVLFKNNNITGILDFYYACSDYLIIDIAIVIISWCFNNINKEKINIDKSKVRMFLKGYNSVRKLNKLELDSLDYFCRIYCIRFCITRLIDKKLGHDINTVITKNPDEFINKYLYLKNKNFNVGGLFYND